MSRHEWTNEKLFSRLCNNKSERNSDWDSIRELRKRATKEIFDKSVELTRSVRPKERRIGVHVLAQLGKPPRPFYSESIKCFFELLELESSSRMLQILLSAIGHNNEKLSKAQIEKLCAFGDSKSSLVKEGLVMSLLTVDDPKAVDTLIKLSSDKLDYIRDWATFGLGTQIAKNNSKIREALWKRVDDKYASEQVHVVY